ncbi:hypothetical protein B7494_g3055 [Chlorociboria aeruginascens]|nr:hypothetical protein B7494_g3055 [Chlorociboria aeruginascens]
MATNPNNIQDPITEEEISGTALPASSSKSAERNAFTTLMSSKRKQPADEVMPSAKRYFPGKDGLGAYTLHPENYDLKSVIYFDKDFVVINDLYPKSSIHTLLLPRSSKNLLHPFDAFEDLTFLAQVQAEASKLRTLVAKELRRKYGRFSAGDKIREATLNGDIDIPDGEDLPEGRDWEKEIKAGIHAHPSMNHLHVHVLSVDRFSENLKHRKHYNSFATPFFIPIEDFPLAKDDVRRHPGREGYLHSDMKCWKCGKNFGNKFAKLKEHLAEEFEKWKAE